MIKRPPHASAAAPAPVRGAAPPERPAGTAGENAAALGEKIGHELKAMFEHVVAEPVPEKFRRLLEQLEAKPGKR